MDAIVRSSSKSQTASVRDAWQKIKGAAELGAGYYASADDAVTASRLLRDLGAVGTQVYIKNYGGKPHIIIKGRPGLRKILTGTKYGIKNPKVISMGLGKSAAVSAARQGGILTVCLLCVYRIADYFLTDEVTLSQLVGTLATDIVKVGITTGAAIVIASMNIVATFAIGPIVAVVLVGFGVAMILELADRHLGITERVIASLDEMGDDVEQYIARKKREAVAYAGKALDDVINYAVESAREIAVTWIQETIQDYLQPFPRLK
ncbi:MAG: hypothetical protein ACFB2Z_08575 [Maricaulaceae bacterium]